MQSVGWNWGRGNFPPITRLTKARFDAPQWCRTKNDTVIEFDLGETPSGSPDFGWHWHATDERTVVLGIRDAAEAGLRENIWDTPNSFRRLSGWLAQAATERFPASFADDAIVRRLLQDRSIRNPMPQTIGLKVICVKAHAEIKGLNQAA